MISEAVSARLPVVGVAPTAHRFTDEEQAYRAMLIDKGWCRVLPIAALTPPTFAAALKPIRRRWCRRSRPASRKPTCKS